MSPTASKYEQSDRQGEAIDILNRCFDFMWYFHGQRRREKFKKALEGALKFFPGIIKPSQDCVFKASWLKEKMFSEYGKEAHIPAFAETMSDYWFHKTGTKKTISVLQISKF